MSTTTPKDTPFTPDWQAANDRAVQANERLVEVGRKATGAYLDSVEKYVGSLTGYERKLSEQSQFGPFAGLLQAQAELTDHLTAASVGAVRELLAR